MKKRILIVALLAVGLVASGVFLWPDGKGGAESAGMPFAAGPQAVAVLTLAPQDVLLTRTLPGRVAPARQSEVRPQVDGLVTARLFEEGAAVEKGDRLYQIDDARYKAELNSAKAALKSARANVTALEARAARYKDLVKIEAVSRQEYDDIKAQLDQALAAVGVAQAAVDLAQVDLDYTHVTAPIAGRIGRSLVTEGALVTKNQPQPMAVITQLDPVYVDMRESGTAAAAVQARLAQGVSVPVQLLPQNGGVTNAVVPQGTLAFSEVTVDESADSVALRAVIPNPDGLLLPGLFVRAEIDVAREKALLVPQRAAIRGADGAMTVWVADAEDKAHPRTVTVGDAVRDSWIVKEGLADGDRVIVEGYQKLAPGAAVSPAPWQDGGT